ncbi:MAG: PilZ domain-containing protein [Deltaproteobacteria bacterium]|nr:PilZ domain-containing protein [Deltaproteobacteria bacterium]
MEIELKSKHSVTEARLRQIAANRLRSLGLQIYVAGQKLKGRLRVEPGSLLPLEGSRFESDQVFVVHGHEFLEFVEPSPLSLLGLVNFFDVANRDELVTLIARLWAHEAKAMTQRLARARQYIPATMLVRDTWTLDAPVELESAHAVFRFDKEVARATLVAIGGQPVREGSFEPSQLNLPGDATLFHVQQLSPIVRAALQGASDTLDVKPIDLGLDRASLSSPDVHGRPTLRPAAPAAPVEEVPAEKALSLSPVQVRRPRVKLDVAAHLSVGASTLAVRCADANAGGVFVRIPLKSAPAAGTTCHLSGFGPLGIDARVVHHRSAQEAEVFGTGEGIGLAFVDPRDQALVKRQSEPFVLVLAPPGEPRERAIAACVAASLQPMLAQNLVSAAVWLQYAKFGLVIIDEHFQAGAWAPAFHALHLAHLPLTAALLGPPDRAREALPEKMAILDPAGLDGVRLRQLILQPG